MIGWKQAYTTNVENIVLVKLEIPKEAKVIHLGRGIYRCDRATVKRISSFDGKHSVKKALSLKDGDFKYEVGKTVYSNASMSACFCEFCGDRTKPKGPGIYFFKTKKEAIKYEY